MEFATCIDACSRLWPPYTPLLHPGQVHALQLTYLRLRGAVAGLDQRAIALALPSAAALRGGQ